MRRKVRFARTYRVSSSQIRNRRPADILSRNLAVSRLAVVVAFPPVLRRRCMCLVAWAWVTKWWWRRQPHSWYHVAAPRQGRCLRHWGWSRSSASRSRCALHRTLHSALHCSPRQWSGCFCERADHRTCLFDDIFGQLSELSEELGLGLCQSIDLSIAI